MESGAAHIHPKNTQVPPPPRSKDQYLKRLGGIQQFPFLLRQQIPVDKGSENFEGSSVEEKIISVTTGSSARLQETICSLYDRFDIFIYS